MELFEFCSLHFFLGCKVWFDELGVVFSALCIVLSSFLMLNKFFKKRGKKN